MQRLCYLRNLRATRPPATNRAPAPSANREAAPSPEPEREPHRAEAAEQHRAGAAEPEQPSAAGAAGAERTGPWPQLLRPAPLLPHPYTRPRPSRHQPWPPWPWRRQRPPARPGPGRARRPAAPPPASPPASSTSSTYLSPLVRKFVSPRRRALKKGPPSKRATRSTLPLRLFLASSRRGLVDLLVTSGLVRGADRDGGADLLELEFVGGGAVLENVGHVLRVAGVANPLDARTLSRVITTARDLERLIELAALAFLLFLLRNLRDDRT